LPAVKIWSFSTVSAVDCLPPRFGEGLLLGIERLGPR